MSSEDWIAAWEVARKHPKLPMGCWITIDMWKIITQKRSPTLNEEWAYEIQYLIDELREEIS